MIDFAFIDGDHSYEGVKLDWEVLSPRMTEFGVVVFHDTLWDRRASDPPTARRAGPQWACPGCLEELRLQGYPVVTIDRDWGLSIVQACRGGEKLSGTDA